MQYYESEMFGVYFATFAHTLANVRKIFVFAKIKLLTFSVLALYLSRTEIIHFVVYF